MEVSRDAEAVAGDEDAIEDDRRAGRIEGDALGLERGRPDRAPELARLAPSEAHRGDGLVRAPDDDPKRALERLQRLPEGHERDAEARREPALGVEPRPGTERALADPRTQRFGDLVVARQATVDPSVPIHRKSSRCSRTPSSQVCRGSTDAR